MLSVLAAASFSKIPLYVVDVVHSSGAHRSTLGLTPA
jgi:hypothetical protein